MRVPAGIVRQRITPLIVEQYNPTVKRFHMCHSPNLPVIKPMVMRKKAVIQTVIDTLHLRLADSRFRRPCRTAFRIFPEIIIKSKQILTFWERTRTDFLNKLQQYLIAPGRE